MQDYRPATDFDRARRGYDPARVDERLAELDATIVELHRDRARAAAATAAQAVELERLRQRTETLRDQVDVVGAVLARARTSAHPGAHVGTARIIALLTIAQDTRAEFTRQVGGADPPREDDDEWATELDRRRIAEIDEVRGSVAAGRSAAAELLRQAHDEALALRTAAAQEAAAIRAAAEQYAGELTRRADGIRAQLHEALDRVDSMSTVLGSGDRVAAQ